MTRLIDAIAFAAGVGIVAGIAIAILLRATA